MTDPDVPGPSDPYLREHLHWYTLKPSKKNKIWRILGYSYHEPSIIEHISVSTNMCQSENPSSWLITNFLQNKKK